MNSSEFLEEGLIEHIGKLFAKIRRLEAGIKEVIADGSRTTGLEDDMTYSYVTCKKCKKKINILQEVLKEKK